MGLAINKAMIEQHAVYAGEKFSEALDILSTHPGNIHDRLRAAASAIMRVPREGIPNCHGFDEDIIWIQDRLTLQQPRYPGQGRVAATLHGMHSTTAIKIARRIRTAEEKLNSYIKAHLNAR
jgi:hypothetical protein